MPQGNAIGEATHARTDRRTHLQQQPNDAGSYSIPSISTVRSGPHTSISGMKKKKQNKKDRPIVMNMKPPNLKKY